MKKLIALFASFVLFVSFVSVSQSKVYADCPWWMFDSCTPTPTMTPTPTPVIFQMAPLLNKDLIKLIGTTTPTPTVTMTPSPTVTVTPTVTTTVALSPTVTVAASETPMVSPTVEPSVTENPKPTQTLVAGFTNREIAFGALVIVVLFLLILQGNWAKIKAWLHKKTE